MASNRLTRIVVLMSIVFALCSVSARAEDLPRLEHKGGRYTFVVNGKPFFLLGAQVGNSSGWPERLEQLWPLAAAMHVNTLEVPVYWEQLEPREDSFEGQSVRKRV